MENVSLANALVPQGKTVDTGKAPDGVTDGGGQFGMLLTQQLQQIEIASDAVAAAQIPVAESMDAGADERLRDALLVQTGQSGISATRLARDIGKTDDIAEKDGKKLPPGLPVESKSEPAPLVDDAVLASMLAAQVAPQTYQPVPQTGSSRVDDSMVAEKRSAVLESVLGKGVSLQETEMHTAISSETSVTTPQVNSQPFVALMAERTAASATPVSIPTLEIPQRVDSAQWGGELGDKVVWMVGSQTQGAELRLNPPALGPLEVRVSMADGQATLSFVTQHAPVREAIEAATPRLREMLAESGINLGSVSVNVGTFAQQQPGYQEQPQQKSSAGRWATAFDEGDASFAPSVATSARYLRDGGMVDLFA